MRSHSNFDYTWLVCIMSLCEELENEKKRADFARFRLFQVLLGILDHPPNHLAADSAAHLAADSTAFTAGHIGPALFLNLAIQSEFLGHFILPLVQSLSVGIFVCLLTQSEILSNGVLQAFQSPISFGRQVRRLPSPVAQGIPSFDEIARS
jgi:hypothetical protein